MIELRKYQTEAVDKARKLVQEGSRRVLIVAPTGSGKTVMASHIIHSAVNRGSRVLFLAHRRELIDQTSEKLDRFGVPHGVLLSGRSEALQRPVQVASVQTLARRKGRVTMADIVFIDEAHHTTTSNTYAELLSWFPGAVVIGLTATPYRLDGRGLADVFDSQVISCTPKQLRDLGFLVPVGGWEYDGITTRGIRVSRGDFNSAELEKRAIDPKLFGNIIAEWQKYANNARTVLFACTVAHSKALMQAFREAGVKAEHVDANTPDGERKAILNRLRTGETRLLCNVNVVTEGFDLPELECAILARPTLSTALYLQMVGRILRPAKESGKTHARIHDHARCLATHGHPYADRDLSMQLTATQSRSASDGGPASSKIRHCDLCRAVIEDWPCAACGHRPSQREIEIQLAAERRAIDEANRPPQPRSNYGSVEERRAEWEQKDDEMRALIWERCARKHGIIKGANAYYFISGFTERPSSSEIERVRHKLLSEQRQTQPMMGGA